MTSHVQRKKYDSIKSSKNTQSTIKYLKKHKWLYVLLLPGMLFLFIFNYIPIYGILIAFKDFNIISGIWDSEWVGLSNFTYLFQSDDFIKVFKNSLWISILRLVWSFPAPIVLALFLNEIRNMRFKKGVQTIIYVPHFISWVVIAGMVMNLLSPSSGAINHVIQFFGGEPIAFLQKPEYFRSILVISGIWKEAGWGTIIYLAAITGIDTAMYEAAIIDGASRLQRIWYITLPGIRSTIIVLLILRMGSMLRNGFEQIFLLYNALVYDVADVFETYTYRIGLIEGRFSFATAVGLFQSVVGLILILTANKLARKYGEGGLW